MARGWHPRKCLSEAVDTTVPGTDNQPGIRPLPTPTDGHCNRILSEGPYIERADHPGSAGDPWNGVRCPLPEAGEGPGPEKEREIQFRKDGGTGGCWEVCLRRSDATKVDRIPCGHLASDMSGGQGVWNQEGQDQGGGLTLYSGIPTGRPISEEETVKLYAPVVNWCVARIRASLHLDRDDMVQNANIGLLEAYRSYRPDRGATFRTYATHMVKWAIFNGNRFVDVGLYNLRRSPVDYVDPCPSVSLEELVERFGDHHPQLVAGDSDGNGSPGVFEALLSIVPQPRARHMIELRYRDDWTLDMIGERYGLTRERVRQIIVKGLKAIGARLRKEGPRR